MMFTVDFFIGAPYQVQEFSFYSQFAENYYHKWGLNFVEMEFVSFICLYVLFLFVIC